MKRALLIAGGTLGGLGAVLAITPPQFTSSSSLGLSGAMGSAAGTATSTPAAVTTTQATPTQSAAAQAAPTQSATAKPAKTKKAKATKTTTATAKATATAAATAAATQSATPTPTATKTTAAPTPAATKTTAAPAGKSVTGTFDGPSIFVNYGNVQVQLTVVNGKITDARALSAPNGRSQRWTDMAIPVLRQQTLAAQSDAIQGASGASYTSYGWYKSLQGALAKAGL